MIMPPESAGSVQKYLLLSPINSGSSFAQRLLMANGLPFADEQCQRTLFKHYHPTLIKRIARLQKVDLDSICIVIMVRNPWAWYCSTELNRYEFVFSDCDSELVILTTALNYDKTYAEHFRELRIPETEYEEFFRFKSIFAYWQSYYWAAFELGDEFNVVILPYEELLTHPAECVHELKGLVGHDVNEYLRLPMTPSIDHGNPVGFLDARRKLFVSALSDFSRRALAVGDRFDPHIMRKLGYETTVETDGSRPEHMLNITRFDSERRIRITEISAT